MTEVDINKLCSRVVSRDILKTLPGVIIRDKYRLSLGELVSVDVKNKIAIANIYDENPREFLKAFKSYIYRKMEESSYNYIGNAIKAAEDFHYGDEVIKAINNARSDAEVARIMQEARRKKFG